MICNDTRGLQKRLSRDSIPESMHCWQIDGNPKGFADHVTRKGYISNCNRESICFNVLRVSNTKKKLKGR